MVGRTKMSTNYHDAFQSGLEQRGMEIPPTRIRQQAYPVDSHHRQAHVSRNSMSDFRAADFGKEFFSTSPESSPNLRSDTRANRMDETCSWPSTTQYAWQSTSPGTADSLFVGIQKKHSMSTPLIRQETNPIHQQFESNETTQTPLCTSPAHQGSRTVVTKGSSPAMPRSLQKTKMQLLAARGKVERLAKGQNTVRSRLASAVAEEDRSRDVISTLEQQVKDLRQLKADEIESLIQAAEEAEADSQQLLRDRDEELKRLDLRLADTTRSVESIISVRSQAATQTEQVISGLEVVQKELKRMKQSDRQFQRAIATLQRQLSERQEIQDKKLAEAERESERHRQTMSTIEANHKEREDSLQAQVEQMRARQMGPKQEEKLLLMEQRVLLLETESEKLRATLEEGKSSVQHAAAKKKETQEEATKLKIDIARLRSDGAMHLREREAEVALAMKQLEEVMVVKDERYSRNAV